MNKRLLGFALVVIAAGVVLVVLALVFLSNTPAESSFEFAMPPAPTLEAMTPEEIEALEIELVAAMPDMDDMPGDEKRRLEDRVMGMMAQLPVHELQEPLLTPQDTEPVLLVQSEFRGAGESYMGDGSVFIYEMPSGARLLRFEGLDVTRGPSLHVMLAESSDPGAGLGQTIDLGRLKSPAGSQNYTLPAGAELTDYQSVVIYSQPFQLVFAVATLN